MYDMKLERDTTTASYNDDSDIGQYILQQRQCRLVGPNTTTTMLISKAQYNEYDVDY